MTKKRQGMLKEGVAVWARIPGTPFTLPGSPTVRERLPGMSDWASRDMITRMAQGLDNPELKPEELATSEGQKGLPRNITLGALGGGTAGALAGRVAAGKQGIEPLLQVSKKGINTSTLRALKHMPTAMKLLPLLGLIGGGVAGAAHWASGKDDRKRQALDVSKGLLAERIYQSNALKEALKSNNPYTSPLLRGVPLMSAQTPMPHVMRYGGIGV